MNRIRGSFRDPSGHVYESGGRILRTVNHCYQGHWVLATESGLLAESVKHGLIPSFTECAPPTEAWKCLEVETIPFISYPYEWSFSQLKDAALLTLKLQRAAIEKGMVLKDATAYNVQFCGSKPVFIDLLSFETWKEGAPWQAYRQFCMHFLAPLALCSSLGLWAGNLLRQWIDGIPLSHACAMLPWHTRIRPTLALHLFAHAHMEQRHADARKSATMAKATRLSRSALLNLTTSLQQSVEALKLPAQTTQWGDYYEDTNYSDRSAAAKLEAVERIAAEHAGGRLAVDLGANTGLYSRALAAHFSQVIAADIDPLAVERHYNRLKCDGPGNILPLVIDLANPSPSLGWSCAERDSFQQRCSADFIMALALIHHLVIAAGIPFRQVAAFLASIMAPGATLLIEFVPKDDSQVQRLLAAREDIFSDYTLEDFRKAFGTDFSEEGLIALPDSCRTLLCFRKNQIQQ